MNAGRKNIKLNLKLNTSPSTPSFTATVKYLDKRVYFGFKFTMTLQFQVHFIYTAH